MPEKVKKCKEIFLGRLLAALFHSWECAAAIVLKKSLQKGKRLV